MECHRALSLVVLTLLQLCRAEINDAQPQWYSANVINDGFQPKSISEIFSSEAPFSTANPIVVSSIDSHDDIRMLSTLSPPTSLAGSTTGFTQTSTHFPPSSQSSSTGFSPSQPPSSQYTTPPPLQHFKTPTTQPVEAQPTHHQRNVQIQQEQTASTQSLLYNSPTYSQPTETPIPQDIGLQFIQQGGLTSIGLEASTAGPPHNIPLPNLFLTYHQQPIQSYPHPSSSASTTLGEQSYPTADTPYRTSSEPPIFSSSSPTFATHESSPITIGTSPLFSTTTHTPVTENLTPSTFPRVTVTSLSSIGSSSSFSSHTKGLNCTYPRATSPIPRFNSGKTIDVPMNHMFPLKISVRSPSGSITNVNLNPVVKARPSPKPTQKTTRKPTTRRTQKPKRNTYDRCLQGCKKGHPLCAAPLSQSPVDPKTLRGFPSVCHMACHNSHRKDSYEKITDGTCSKLRTRIRPIDSDSKLKKDELHKVQYFLDNSGPPTVVELSGGYS